MYYEQQNIGERLDMCTVISKVIIQRRGRQICAQYL